ncbi:transforming growth factor-beta-induced protein ig-h3 [Ceratitis capitata]|uniref:transforming growth factor-beta-induced protein ig-h3 n=1 Tax=Ceratitis capitata TaxID=7213 RepID=UPI000329784D|nr:transforming growth factor-beta-induced protein ig-h3 [Ceratitis capitata]
MLRGSILVLTLLLTFGYLQALPYYGDNFDDEAEFVPLEQQQHQQQQHQLHQGRAGSPNAREKPFEVDVITSEVNGDNNPPGVFFQQSFPFLGNDFFNSFGGFGFGGIPREHWWKGPNVCTDKEEDEKVVDPKADVNGTEELAPGVSESIDVRPQNFAQFQFSLNSCVERSNKYVCTRVINQNGKKKTITITRQCCHGYGRPRNADFATPCEKMEIKNIDATAADMGAKEFVATAKNAGIGEVLANKNVTIFMPVDAAFNNYIDQLQSENNAVEPKGDGAMMNLYKRHIVDGEISLYDLKNDQLLKTQQPEQSIRINAFEVPLALGGEPYRFTANCIPIEKHDKLSEQGLIHTVDGVMKPVTKNVMDLIRERADMSIMRTVLENTKLNKLLEGEKPVTVFVPTDDAFDKVDPHLRRALKEGKGCGANILKNHILDLTFCSVASIPGAKTTAYNLLGEAMRFNRSQSAAGKSEVADLVGEQPVVINGIAKITEADIMGTNGVLHVIDTILPTESALPLSTLMQEKNVTIFKRLLEAAGLDNKYDDMDNVTVFAPTDKALQGTKWPQLLEESPEKLSNNAELIEFLNYHVVQPMTKTCDLVDSTLPTVAGPEVRINLYSTHALFSNVMNRATVNCARLVHFDDESCGSVLHQVDKPLVAPKMNLLQLLESNPMYSKFLELVRAANLTTILSNADDSYTLLVPKNDVFEEVADWETTLTKDKSELENLIKTHIVNDVVCCAGIIPTNWPFVRSIEALNGAHLRITRDRRPKIENAGVTKCDAIATNGIVHEINDILIPQRRQHRPQQPSYQPHLDTFGDLFF